MELISVQSFHWLKGVGTMMIALQHNKEPQYNSWEIEEIVQWTIEKPAVGTVLELLFPKAKHLVISVKKDCYLFLNF